MFLMNIHIDILITQHLHNLHEYSEVAAESVFFESHLRIHQQCFESVEAEFAFQEKKAKVTLECLRIREQRKRC